jgi:hypothetical protein
MLQSRSLIPRISQAIGIEPYLHFVASQTLPRHLQWHRETLAAQFGSNFQNTSALGERPVAVQTRILLEHRVVLCRSVSQTQTHRSIPALGHPVWRI